MSSPYSFLPEVRRAERRASDTARAAEHVARALERALLKLATHDLRAAQAIRGEAYQHVRGIMPHIATAFDRLPLAHQAGQAAAPTQKEREDHES